MVWPITSFWMCLILFHLFHRLSDLTLHRLPPSSTVFIRIWNPVRRASRVSYAIILFISLGWVIHKRFCWEACRDSTRALFGLAEESTKTITTRMKTKTRVMGSRNRWKVTESRWMGTAGQTDTTTRYIDRPSERIRNYAFIQIREWNQWIPNREVCGCISKHFSCFTCLIRAQYT